MKVMLKVYLTVEADREEVENGSLESLAESQIKEAVPNVVACDVEVDWEGIDQ